MPSEYTVTLTGTHHDGMLTATRALPLMVTATSQDSARDTTEAVTLQSHLSQSSLIIVMAGARRRARPLPHSSVNHHH